MTGQAQELVGGTTEEAERRLALTPESMAEFLLGDGGIDPKELQVYDPDQYSVFIVGQARAGKSKLNTIINNEWATFVRDHNAGPTVEFSNSNGFRGFTYSLAKHYRLPPKPTEDEVMSILNAHNPTKWEAIARSRVLQPLDVADLRSDEVEASISEVSSVPEVRRLVNTAGQALVERYFVEDGYGLVVIDARSAAECMYKLEKHSEVIGRFILTCDPLVAAEREVFKDKTGKKKLDEEAAKFQARNDGDRARKPEAGQMTLPVDYEGRVISLADLVKEPDEARRILHLFVAGYRQVKDSYFIHLATDDPALTEEVERVAVPWILRGALTAAAVKKYETQPLKTLQERSQLMLAHAIDTRISSYLAQIAHEAAGQNLLA